MAGGQGTGPIGDTPVCNHLQGGNWQSLVHETSSLALQQADVSISASKGQGHRL